MKKYKICMSLILAIGLLHPGIVSAERQAQAASRPVVSVEDFYKRSLATQLKISPNGEYLAATMPLEDHTDLVILDRLSLKVVSQVKFKDKSHVDDYFWVNPTRILFTEKQKKGSLSEPRPLPGIYAINADGSKNLKLSDATLIDTLVNENDWVLVESRGIIRRLNVNNGKVEISKYRNPITNGSFVTDNSGEVRFFSGRRAQDFPGRLYVYQQADDKWLLINEEKKTGHNFDVLGFSTDNKTAYISISEKTGPAALHAFDMTTHQKVLVVRDNNVDPANLVFGPGNRGAFAIRYLDGKPRTEFLDVADPYARDLQKLQKAFPKSEVFATSFTHDGNLGLYYVYADDNPGAYYLYDRASGKATYVLNNGTSIDSGSLSETEPVKFKARDGVEIEGFLTIPKYGPSQNLPVVVLVHGGPFGIFDQWGYDPDVQILANRGYAVFQVNFRGSGNYGQAFVVAGYRQWGRAMQDDLTDATRWLIDNNYANKEKICIYGASYGAYAALMGAAKEPALYKCAIGNVGVYDLRRVMLDDTWRGYSTMDVKWYALTMGLQDLEEISPNLIAKKIKIPVLLGAGKEDETAPPLHTERMRDALIKNGTPVDSVIYEGEGHGNYLQKNQIDWANRVLMFLDRQLGPGAGK